MMKKTRVLVFTLLFSLLLSSLSACGGAESIADGKVLLCYAGDSRDEFGGGVYAAAVKQAKCGFRVVELGKNPANYRGTVEEALGNGDADTIVIVGRDAYNGLADYVKSFKGMNFIVVDAALTEIPENVLALEFQPEEYGYLCGRMTASGGGEEVGYVSTYQGRLDNRI